MGCRLSHSSSTEDNNNHHQPVDDDDGQQLTVTSHKRPHRFFRRDKPSTTTPTAPTTSLSTEDDDYSIILTSAVGCNRSSSGTIRSPSNNAVLSRRDTPAIGSMIVDNRVLNGTTAEVPVSTTTTFDANFEESTHIEGTTTAVCTKPIGQSMESESQADFFRMLDEKIAHGADYELDIMR